MSKNEEVIDGQKNCGPGETRKDDRNGEGEERKDEGGEG